MILEFTETLGSPQSTDSANLFTHRHKRYIYNKNNEITLTNIKRKN
jgi:hypothetical protein